MDHTPFAGMAQEATLSEAAASLKEAVAALLQAADQLAILSPDVAGRLRVNAEVVANIATITTVSSVTTVANLANQTNMGGYSATPTMIALMLGDESALRRNIVIS